MKLNLDKYEMEVKDNINIHGKFINREISLLAFDERVLYYALNSQIPLNERMNFLAITGSNLDEFISVRFPDVYHNKEKEPYKDILKRIKKFKDFQNHVFQKTLRPSLEKKGVHFVKISDLSKKEKSYLW